jgi:MraZ protein
MALFLSHMEKKIDRKGRVSVPSAFRAVLAEESFQGLVVYQSFVNPCIEACGMSRIEALMLRIEMLDPFSEEYDAFTTSILGGSVQLPFDGEGRVVMPEHLLAAVDIKEDAVFVGKGATFEIWQPTAFAEHAANARKVALEKRLHLRAPSSPSVGEHKGGVL